MSEITSDRIGNLSGKIHHYGIDTIRDLAAKCGYGNPRTDKQWLTAVGEILGREVTATTYSDMTEEEGGMVIRTFLARLGLPQF